MNCTQWNTNVWIEKERERGRGMERVGTNLKVKAVHRSLYERGRILKCLLLYNNQMHFEVALRKPTFAQLILSKKLQIKMEQLPG